MKFRYYVTDISDGTIKGTNDTVVATSLAECEDFFVVDTSTGQWLLSDGSMQNVIEIESQG